MLEYPERFDRVVLMGPGGTPNTKLSLELARAKSFYDNPSKKRLQQIMGWFVYDKEAMQPVIDGLTDARFENAMREEVSAQITRFSRRQLYRFQRCIKPH